MSVDTILEALKPFWYAAGVQKEWMLSTALTVVFLTKFVKGWLATESKARGWATIAVAAALTFGYACVEYLPSFVTVLAGALMVGLLSAGMMKGMSWAGKATNKMMPKSNPSTRG